MNVKKYKRYEGIDLKNRKWPDSKIEKAPIWCSVDLRDGNQALPIPMNIETKLEYLSLLKDMGFKEIETGFPSASDTEFNFTRKIIEEGFADDITIQVLTQAREHLIKRTFEAISDTNSAIVHVYNSTSTQQRKIVFKKSKEDIIKIAQNGALMVKDIGDGANIKDLRYEYSPESFTDTEMDYAVDVCEKVIEVFNPTKDKPLILNLPATVERGTPNVYADQIEWFIKNIRNNENIIISLHAHNDQGTAVAATELALLAGANRVEGTLFGNGERTGNADILTLALNMYSQGIDPGLKIDNINEIVKVYEKCTQMKVHDRHPYAGSLVYTAFSGSHQDAIRKGFNMQKEKKGKYWDVPYLPIDPKDIGREYEAIIRINSQSGKGGVAFVLEKDFGFILPKEMHPEFGMIIKKETDEKGRELSSKEIYDKFKEVYLNEEGLYSLKSYAIESVDDNVKLKAKISKNKEEISLEGEGNGPISAFFNGLKKIGIDKYAFETYKEHALSSGADAEACAYIELKNSENNVVKFGVGIDKNTTKASLKAILCAINRMG